MHISSVHKKICGKGYPTGILNLQLANVYRKGRAQQSTRISQVVQHNKARYSIHNTKMDQGKHYQ